MAELARILEDLALQIERFGQVVVTVVGRVELLGHAVERLSLRVEALNHLQRGERADREPREGK